MLLTAGRFEPGKYNAMTVSWGAVGVIWGKPLAMVVVRPQRHTYRFMEEHEHFTLCGFPEMHRQALNLLGSVSGRDRDKIKASGLTPMAATRVRAPAYEEARLVLECRKIYFDDLKPEHFLAPEISGNYPTRDYHRMYFGEILAIQGAREYQ
jgi:flavin reductase (DIM6/NTAB) family NADH-FMN oxidoreductase RutF